MEWLNDDGAGVAWVENSAVHYAKGLRSFELFDMASSIEGPRLVHFRMATAGGDSPLLCHPFPITRKAELRLQGWADSVLIHNGHWSGHELAETLMGPLPKGPWSDTRLMARILALRARVDVWAEWLVKDQHVGKLATLDKEGTLAMYGNWTEHNGAYYSNMHWGYESAYTYSTGVGGWADASNDNDTPTHLGGYFGRGGYVPRRGVRRYPRGLPKDTRGSLAEFEAELQPVKSRIAEMTEEQFQAYLEAMEE